MRTARCRGPLVALERLDHVATAWVPKARRHQHDRADAHPGPVGLRHGRPEVPELAGPDVGVVTALVARDRPEGLRAARILLDLRELVVQRDRVALELEVLRARRRWGHQANRTQGAPALICRMAPPYNPPDGRADRGPIPSAAAAALALRRRRGGDAAARGAPATRRADDDRARPPRRSRAPTEDRHPPAPGGLVQRRDAVAPVATTRPATSE